MVNDSFIPSVPVAVDEAKQQSDGMLCDVCVRVWSRACAVLYALDGAFLLNITEYFSFTINSFGAHNFLVIAIERTNRTKQAYRCLRTQKTFYKVLRSPAPKNVPSIARGTLHCTRTERERE
mmetsp:Transcript_75030/g.152327  ORF Transcript_75030/g.152327 Transcript_75030/m.152327 type:complete len:122 (-) Transcript_75030:703-1068(-)